jgi:hypothetical protein
VSRYRPQKPLPVAGRTGLQVGDNLTLKVNGKPVTPWIADEVFARGAIIAAALAMPAGLILQDVITCHQAAKAGFVLPGSFVHVLGAADLTLLALAGLAIAAIGALGSATWAAASRITTALHAE